MKHSVRFSVYFNQKYREISEQLSDKVAYDIQSGIYIDITEEILMYIRESITQKIRVTEDNVSS